MSLRPVVQINLNHLRHNAQRVKQLAPHANLLAVIKANAYGHGLHEVAASLEAVADGYAVARFEEAIELRKTQPHQRIVILGGVYQANELRTCLSNNIDITVHSEAQLALLEDMPLQPRQQLAAWLKIDTGMHRLGIKPERVTESYQRLATLPFIRQVIAMTHFASADEPGSSFTVAQNTLFQQAILPLGGIETSLCNSAGIIQRKQTHGNWVRPGLMLYGVNPVSSVPLDLKPVMTLHGPVVALRSIEAGESVGYNQTWRAPAPSLIATVALGYADGYPIQIAPGTSALYQGKRVTIVGRVSMDLITLDITGAASPCIGDRVVFWGEDTAGNLLPVEEIANRAGTIPYELLVGVGKRVSYCY